MMELADEGKFINYQESGSTHYLPVREVNTVFRDLSGLMWIGTKGAGVFHVDTRKRSFNVIYPRGNDKSFTDLISTLYVDEGGNLAASKIRNLECPSYEICLIDYGCGKFNRKIHIMEQYP